MNIDPKLLDKFSKGECTSSELEVIKQYFQQNDLSQIDGLLKEEWDKLEPAAENPEIREAIWQRLPLLQGPTQGGVIRHTGRRFYRFAAAAVVLLILTAGWFLFLDRYSDINHMVEHVNDTAVPLEIQLEDGTQVWLKPMSKLLRPEHFPMAAREVQLIGEAYSDVEKDNLRPFTVTTGNVKTRVLGTIFNVRAFPGDEMIQIALVEGKVAVERNGNKGAEQLATLSPGETFLYQNSNGAFSKKQITVDSNRQFQEGIIHFRHAGIRVVVETLENWYGVQIQVQNENSITETLVHRIDTRKMGIEEVLEGISLVAGYRFEKIGENKYALVIK